MITMKSITFLFTFVLIMISSSSIACGDIIYVKHDAQGFLNDGSSWTNAYVDLQSALDEAESCPDIQEIWVSEGTYLPTVDIGGGTGSGIQNLVFNIDFDIKIYGGFCGWESDLNERVKYLCSTILSGDHNEDDVLVNNKNDANFPFSNGADNSYNVIRMKNLTNLTIIDGFTISGGNAFHPSTLSKQIGGAIFNDGRGLNNTSSPQIISCIFQYNKSQKGGGAIYNYGVNGNASPEIIGCQFRYNSTDDNGGAFYNHASGTSFISSPVITSCLFEHNVSHNSGGGFYSLTQSMAEAVPLISQSTFVYNQASLGGGVFIDRLDGLSIDITINGCLFYFNLAIEDPSLSSLARNNLTVTTRYSLYPEATIDQVNYNTNANPQFVNSTYRLQSTSPAIDKGEFDSGFLVSTTQKDIDDNSRRLGELMDIGAYEYLSCPNSDTIYVNDDSNIFRKGTSPTSALSSLNMALSMACNCDGPPVIEIAEGRYVPHRLADLTIANDRKDHSFELGCSVELLGEYGAELSGDILNNDETLSNTGSLRDDNIKNIIKSTGIENITIDELEIYSANNEAVLITGGSQDLNVVLTNSNFRYNNSNVFKISSTGSAEQIVLIDDCTFSKNSIDSKISDGCVNIKASGLSDVDITGCTFNNNDIGGIFISLKDSSHCNIERCNFRENNSYIGGGIEIDDILRGTSFHQISNCTFVDNTAESSGAALYGRRTHDTNYAISNCTFFRNHTESLVSGALNFFNLGGSAEVIDCILWDNTNDVGSLGISGDMDISYSMIENNQCPGGTNSIRCGEVMYFNVDPMFRSENGTFGADLNLKAESPAINRGSKTASGPTGRDIASFPRIQSSRIDLGAYENQVILCPDIVSNPVPSPEINLDISLVARNLIELSQEYITPETGALFLDARETTIGTTLEIEVGAVMEVYTFGCNN